MKTFYQLRNEDGRFLTLIDGTRMSFSKKSGKIYRSLESAETDLYWHQLVSAGDNNIQPLTIVSYTETSNHTETSNVDFRKARDFLHAIKYEDYHTGSRRDMLTSLLKDLSIAGESFKYIMLLKNDGGLKIDKKLIVGRADGQAFKTLGYVSTMLAVDNDAALVYMRMQFSDYITKVWDENGNLLINLET